MKKKIGLFGGSFDPIHIGHMIVASVVRSEFNLERVVFIPNYASPFKQNSFTTDINHRLEMIKLAISDNNEFELSDFEASKNRAVYTYETLEHFKLLYPDAVLSLIIGYDSYKTLSTWKNSSYIIDNSDIIIAQRTEDAIISPDHQNKNIHISKLSPRIGISSTMIKGLIANNLNIKYLVNEKVRHYIIRKSMYTANLNKLV
jgi:nicotinate-nucleotide adenylyltransferase